MPETQRTWKTVSSKIVYENPWIRFRHDEVIRPDGKEGIYGYAEKSPGVFVLIESAGQFLLINNYRYPTKRNFWEMPGGVAASGNLEEEAIREAREEVGLQVSELSRLGRIYLGVGHETSYVEIFRCKIDNLEHSTHENQEGDEAIQNVQAIKIEEVLQMLKDGEIEDSVLASALGLWLVNQNSEK